MRLKHFLAFIMLVASFTLAAQDYVYSGVVVEQSGDASIINIDNIEYRIDYETRLHNSLQRSGELAPWFDIGSTLGFNIKQEVGEELPKITDVWVLGN